MKAIWSFVRQSPGLVVFVVVAGFLAFRLLHGAAMTPPASPREPAPAFRLADLDGRVRSLESFRGRPVLVNFWATWCPPCRVELPQLVELAQAHHGCLDVVGVTVDSGSPDDVRAFARKHGLDYTLLMDDGSASRAYGASTIPRSVLVGADGTVLGTFVGTVTRAGVEKALAGVAPPVC